MADRPTPLPAGAVIAHEGRFYRLMHTTQVEPLRPGGGSTAVLALRPTTPRKGGAAYEFHPELIALPA